jgi:hypothetical protein
MFLNYSKVEGKITAVQEELRGMELCLGNEFYLCFDNVMSEGFYFLDKDNLKGDPEGTGTIALIEYRDIAFDIKSQFAYISFRVDKISCERAGLDGVWEFAPGVMFRKNKIENIKWEAFINSKMGSENSGVLEDKFSFIQLR